MPDNERRPFRIPDDFVRREPITPTGYTKPYPRKDYASHGRELSQRLRITKSLISEKRDNDLTSEYVVQVSTPEAERIRTRSRQLHELGLDIVSYSLASENIATAAIKKDQFEQLEERINRYAEYSHHPGKTNISILEDIADVPLEDKLDNSLPLQESEVECIISLFDVLSENEKEVVAQDIASTLTQKGVEDAKVHTYLSGMVAVSATARPTVVSELGRDYNTVQYISPNNAIVITRSVPTEDLPNLLERQQARTDVQVAVIDSGIKADSPALTGLVTETHPFLPHGAVGQDFAHGTLVGSRVIYGDNIEDCLATHRLEPMCKVVDVPVFGIDGEGNRIGPREADLSEVLDMVVSRLASQVKVYNLSLGSNRPISENTFSLLAKQMDYLSRTYNVLFVVAAGNIESPSDSHPSHFLSDSARIQPPAESLLALTVGSIAKHATAVTLSEINEVSPFSCRGPGANDGIKPELVAHGGNMSLSWRSLPRTSAYGIDATGMKLAYDVGTSFSAPLVSQWAARILDQYPDASVNLVKALLCHFASPAITPETGLDLGVIEGFGEPQIESSLASPYGSVTYVYEGSITTDGYQHIQFHVPPSLASGGSRSNLKVRGTLVYNPKVNLSNNLEYSKARMTLALMKSTTAGWKEVPLSSNYPSYRMPWHPVLRFDKNFSRAYTTGIWEARTRLMTRGDLDDDFIQDYALVIEVVDLSGAHDIYDEINSQYGTVYTSVGRRAA